MSRPAPTAGTPWAAALGADVERLAPSLQDYFGGAPFGAHGIGDGVFTRVGTPRRWLWPLLAILARWNIVWPVWEHAVPFTIVNVPTPHGLVGVRRFRFASGDRTMTDRILWTKRGLRQRLGAGERIVTELEIAPDDEGLRITSGRVGIELFGLRLTLPARWSPRISVVERVLPDGRQHVELTLTLPLVGRAYEYAGSFVYRIERAAADDE
ncbi:DUF4166 domain-containing protein [Homoserinibacter sp. GY 40078]|uniref:DUF4166 domain-containing protein n=1 Tax=Homoserinibacter sp. GY 40078 TaxID=2603275 RepID=UPI0011C8CD11|nr:DUF4166 domain-containing protein [Homoserinibacter sp. GY 40078]TXK17574.1 DUF4166 domain-containing protein [Homoserinibacter sp. GY 40078]